MGYGDGDKASHTRGDASTELERVEDLLDDVNGHMDEIHRELAVQVKRARQIQEQLDELRLKFARLAARAFAGSSDGHEVPGRNGDGPPEARPSS